MVTQQEGGLASAVRPLLRVPVPWVFILSYLIGAGLEWVLPPLVRPGLPAGTWIAGAVLFCAGAVIAGWGQMLFRRAHTTTVPGQTSSSLVTCGPYRITRNPMYLGLVLAYLGEAGMLRQLWPVVILPLIVAYVNWVVIPLEETRLREAFGARYEEYRSRVRRWI